MKTLVIAGLFSIMAFSNVKCQSWSWIKGLGFSHSDYERSIIKKTNSGNLVIAYTSRPGESESSDLVFCDQNGAVVWQRHYSALLINDIYVDALQNIYFAGSFKDTLDFGMEHIASGGGYDAVLGSIDANGTITNLKTFGTEESERALSVTVHNNEIFATGGFMKQLNVDGIVLTADGNSEVWVLKLNQNYEAVKGFSTDSSGKAHGVKIHTTANGSVYVLGNATDGFINFKGKKIYISEEGHFLAKFDSELKVQWVNAVVPHFMEGVMEPYILSDKNQNIILLQSTGGTLGSTHDVVVKKIGINGDTLWISAMIPVNRPAFMDIDSKENVWVAGTDNLMDGTSKFSVAAVSPAGYVDQVIANPNVKHAIRGFVLKSDDSFYLAGDCAGGSEPAGFSCTTEGNARFIALVSKAFAESVEENNFEIASAIFPNPCPGKFNIQLSENVADEKIRCCVYDISGHCVQTTYGGGSRTFTVDLAEKEKGIYFIELNSGRTKTLHKILLY
jgi:hypothetical protein